MTKEERVKIVREFFAEPSSIVFGTRDAAQILEKDQRQITRYIKDGRMPKPLYREEGKSRIVIWLREDIEEFKKTL